MVHPRLRVGTSYYAAVASVHDCRNTTTSFSLTSALYFNKVRRDQSLHVRDTTASQDADAPCYYLAQGPKNKFLMGAT